MPLPEKVVVFFRISLSGPGDLLRDCLSPMPSICQSPAQMQQSMPRQEAVPRVALGELKCPQFPGGCDQGGSGVSQLADNGICPSESSCLFSAGAGSSSQTDKTTGHLAVLSAEPFPWNRRGKGKVCSISGFLCSGKLLQPHRVSAAILRFLPFPAIPRGSSLSSGIENNTLLLHFAELLCFL